MNELAVDALLAPRSSYGRAAFLRPEDEDFILFRITQHDAPATLLGKRTNLSELIANSWITRASVQINPSPTSIAGVSRHWLDSIALVGDYNLVASWANRAGACQCSLIRMFPRV